MRFWMAPLFDDVADVDVWIGEHVEVVSDISVEVDMGESIFITSEVTFMGADSKGEVGMIHE